MKIVGLTGGIGSGKTTVTEMFKDLGVPVYVADVEAKALMNRSKIIRRKLIKHFGTNAYDKNDKLNRDYLSDQIFRDKSLLEKINAIVHPKVASHFKRWIKKQDAPYIIKEAAIIFEHNKQAEYDYIVTIITDRETRINRLLKRDKSSRDKILAIMNNQLSDAEKIEKSHFVIENKTLSETKEQVTEIHHKLLANCANSEF